MDGLVKKNKKQKNKKLDPQEYIPPHWPRLWVLAQPTLRCDDKKDLTVQVEMSC